MALAAARMLRAESTSTLADDDLRLRLGEVEPGVVQPAGGDGGIRAVVEQQRALLRGPPAQVRAVELALELDQRALHIGDHLRLGIRGGARGMAVRRELRDPGVLGRLQGHLALDEIEPARGRHDPRIEIQLEGGGIGLGQGGAALHPALQGGGLLLQHAQLFFCPQELGLGPDDRRLVGQDVLDGDDAAVGADPFPGIEGMLAHIAADRGGGEADPGRDRRVADDDRAQIGPADPSDIGEEPGQGQELYRSPRSQSKRHSPIRGLCSAPAPRSFGE